MATPIFSENITPDDNVRALIQEQAESGSTAALPNGREPFPVLIAKAAFNAEQKAEEASGGLEDKVNVENPELNGTVTGTALADAAALEAGEEGKLVPADVAKTALNLKANGADVANHISNFSNPHQVTAAQLGAAETSAENTFSEPQVISGTSNSTMLRVTQLGSGEAFRVEDSTHPDSTAFVISNNGNVGIGVSPDVNVGLSVKSSGIKFSDGSIQASSATGIKTVLAQTTGNVSGVFSGESFLVAWPTAVLVVDGYTPNAGGIVVFTSQANPVENGFWRVAVNNGLTQPLLERPTWFSSITGSVSPLVYITRFGATQAGFVMALTGPLGNSSIAVGTSPITVHRISGRAPTVGIVAIPAASNSTGAVGQIAVDDANNFLYVCTSTNGWKRTALTPF
jgi:hypothetical protein